MIRINCPFCGTRDHSEFSYGGDGSIDYPALDATKEAWHDAVFMRDNICGVQLETWHHVHGCRMWLKIERDTLTHEIHSVRPAHPGLAAALSSEQEAGQ
ncbi:sarcosine oxidase subunit delta [Roseibium sediminicola]|uniref:Sarcosine oxidase subunit delta n=1 Tax=Roseibium sediminicola TaxID=2933272 RepID=A0ABT0GWQ8_9HYPH|nr:sarcosine oxidase subunit delta [Roseibium sp. CAU 1639]MCK7613665.1 sarcosine oxidase subunit delta [Roseibium sp. CAU 1639]